MSEGDERGRPGGELPPEDPTRSTGAGDTGPDGRGGPAPQQPDDRPTGSIRFQDESTVPREPTLAERRARQQADRREREAASAKHLADQAKSKKRKRIMIGAGVTVGVV